jgi:hypothetical protein
MPLVAGCTNFFSKLNFMSTHKPFAGVRRYAFSLVMSTLGVWFSGGIFTASVVVPILGRETAREMALRPPYPLLIGVGIITGYISTLRWRGLCTPWVWVLPAAYLISGMVSWLHTGYNLGDSLHHFFGRDCWPFCQDQYQWTCPLYSSLAFSLGVILPRLRGSSADDGPFAGS